MDKLGNLDLDQIERDAIAAGLEALKKAGQDVVPAADLSPVGQTKATEKAPAADAPESFFLHQPAKLEPLGDVFSGVPAAPIEQGKPVDVASIIDKTALELVSLAGLSDKAKVKKILQLGAKTVEVDDFGYQAFLSRVIGRLAERFEGVDMKAIDEGYRIGLGVNKKLEYKKHLEDSITKILAKAKLKVITPDQTEELEIEWTQERVDAVKIALSYQTEVLESMSDQRAQEIMANDKVKHDILEVGKIVLLAAGLYSYSREEDINTLAELYQQGRYNGAVLELPEAVTGQLGENERAAFEFMKRTENFFLHGDANSSDSEKTNNLAILRAIAEGQLKRAHEIIFERFAGSPDGEPGVISQTDALPLELPEEELKLISTALLNENKEVKSRVRDYFAHSAPEESEKSPEWNAEAIERLDQKNHPAVVAYKEMLFGDFAASLDNPIKKPTPEEERESFNSWWARAKYGEIDAMKKEGLLEDWEKFISETKKAE